MKWIDPKIELPKDQQVVAALIYHWKENWPQSVEISFGTCHHYPKENFPGIESDTDRVTVENCDMVGGGCQRKYFVGQYPDSDRIVAWCDAKDFKKPDFLNHNMHWGEQFSPF